MKKGFFAHLGTRVKVLLAIFALTVVAAGGFIIKTQSFQASTELSTTAVPKPPANSKIINPFVGSENLVMDLANDCCTISKTFNGTLEGTVYKLINAGSGEFRGYYVEYSFSGWITRSYWGPDANGKCVIKTEKKHWGAPNDPVYKGEGTDSMFLNGSVSTDGQYFKIAINQSVTNTDEYGKTRVDKTKCGCTSTPKPTSIATPPILTTLAPTAAPQATAVE